MELVSKATGKLVQVPDDRAQGAFQSGEYGLPKGARIPVTKDGTTGTVSAEEAEAAFASGASIPSREAYKEAESAERYKGAGGALKAGVTGFARGATESLTGMPFDDLAISGAGLLGSHEVIKDDPYLNRHTDPEISHPDDRAREALNLMRDQQGAASMAGEGLGFVAGGLAGGPKGALNAVGHLAESAVPKALGGLGGKVARAAARGTAEGALLGGVGAIDESALGDTDVTAENVVAGIGHGALIGGVGGGLLTAAGAGLSGARSSTGKFIAGLRGEEVEALAERHFGHAAEGGLGDKVQRAYAKAAAAVSGKDAEAIDVLTRLSEEGQAARRGVHDFAKVRQEAATAISDAGAEMVGTGHAITEEARAALRGELGKVSDAEFKRVNDALTKQIKNQERFHAALTEETAEGVRSVSPMKTESYVKNLTNPKTDLTHGAVKGYAESSQELVSALKSLGEIPKPKLEALNAAESSAKTFGDAVAKSEKELVLANQYQHLAHGEHTGYASIASTLGLGAIGGALGGIAGDAKAGAGIGGTAGFVLGALAHPERAIRTMATIERLAAKVDGKISEGVLSFMRGGAPKASAAKAVPASVDILSNSRGESRRTVFEKSVKETQRLAANPQEQAERISKSTGEISQHAPKTAMAIARLAVVGTKYLADHAPQGFAPQIGLVPSKAPPMYTDQEMGEWTRRAAVVNDYTTAIDSLKAGHLTPEEVDALKAVNPRAYDKIRTEIITRVAASPTSLPYGKRVSLSILFDFPADPTLEPDFMAAIQQNYDDRPQSQQPQGSQQQGSKPKSIDVSDSAQNAQTVGQSVGRD